MAQAGKDRQVRHRSSVYGPPESAWSILSGSTSPHLAGRSDLVGGYGVVQLGAVLPVNIFIVVCPMRQCCVWYQDAMRPENRATEAESDAA